MNKIEDLKQKLSSISLGISRIPADTKRDFISLANAKFSGDYGLCIKFCLDQALEYQMYKKVQDEMNMKLDYIISKLEEKEIPKESKKEITLLNGRKIIVKGGNQNG